jgi:phosphodiesterase/alkaline phosphatase D-like protein
MEQQLIAAKLQLAQVTRTIDATSSSSSVVVDESGWPLERERTQVMADEAALRNEVVLAKRREADAKVDRPPSSSVLMPIDNVW